MEPGPGQESVWDYPRPPCIVADTRLVEVSREGRRLARSRGAVRVLETASPPTFYLPPGDVDLAQLERVPGRSHCEWKGEARYLAPSGGSGSGEGAAPIAWTYPDPFPEFESIRDWIAFYPGRVECRVDGERVRPQPGGFYGGWITDEIVGPVKGEPGSEAW